MNSVTGKIFLSLLALLTLGSFSISEACGGRFTVIPACGTSDGAVIYDGPPSDTFGLTLNGVFTPPTQTGNHVEFNNLPGGSDVLIAGQSTPCSISIIPMWEATANPTNITVTPTAATCGLCDGTITITANSVTNPVGGPIYYQIQLGNNAPLYNNTGVFTNLCAGTYTVTVAAGVGCQVVTTTQILAGTLSVFLSPSAVCVGNTISSFPLGGTAPYTYQWSNSSGPIPGATNPTFTPTSSDLYTVKVTDSAGCVFIAGPVPATQCQLGIQTISQTSQNTFNLGEVTFIVSGGVPPYSVNGGTFQSNPSFAFPEAAGNYTFTVQDAVGTTISLSTQVTFFPTALIGNVFVTRPSACGVNDASLRATGASGSGSYSFQLVGGSTNTTNLTGVFTGLSTGTYTLTLTDTVANTTNVATFPISNPGSIFPLSVENVTTTPPSSGLANGTSTVEISGGTAPYTYALTGPVNQTITSSSTTVTFVGLLPGTYNVSITDACNQSTTTSFLICAYSWSATLTSTDSANMNGSIEITNVAVAGLSGTPTLSYSRNGGPSQSSPIFSGLSAGPYTVAVQANGCAVSPEQTYVIGTPKGPNASTAGAQIMLNTNKITGLSTVAVLSVGCVPQYCASLVNPEQGLNDMFGPSQANNLIIENLPASGMFTVTTQCNCPPIMSDDAPTTTVMGFTLTGGLPAFSTLDIKKCAPKHIGPDEKGKFTIVVTNTGTQPATNVVVTDVLPSNFEFVPCPTPGWDVQANGQTITATLLGTLAVGESSQFKIKVKGRKTVINEATVNATNATAPATASACVHIS